jgi:hypothetical protein
MCRLWRRIMTDYELEQRYMELLDEAFPPYIANGMEYPFSTILKECDPIAFRVGLSDFEAELESYEEDEEKN